MGAPRILATQVKSHSINFESFLVLCECEFSCGLGFQQILTENLLVRIDCAMLQ